jgi:hypothetical protein
MEYLKICQDLVAAQKDGHIRRHRQLSTYREITNIIETFLLSLTNQSNYVINAASESIKTENKKENPGVLFGTIKIAVSISDTFLDFDVLVTIPEDANDTLFIDIENEDIIHYTKNDDAGQLIKMITDKIKTGLKFA